jgi:hypothetical protein
VQVRHFWKSNFPNRDCLLWVDQICINQKNDSERSHQVSLMREIYSCAEQVIICLSTSRKTSPEGIKWLQQLYQDVPPRENDLDPPSRKDKVPLRGDSDLTVYHFHQVYLHLLNNMVKERFRSGWLAFDGIANSPWWTRAWIYQEFMCSVQAHFLFNRHCIPCTKLSHLLRSLCLVHELLSMQCLYNGDTATEFGAMIEQIRPAMEIVGFISMSKLKWNKPQDLKQLLSHSRNCKSSDDRDRIFAFLGLSHSTYGIVPDYSPANTISRVLIETAKKIILHDNNLEILSYVEPVRSQCAALPSWVPDWTQNDSKKLPTMIENSSTLFQASKGKKANVRFEENTVGHPILKVWGVLLDTLESDVTTSDGSLGVNELRIFRTHQAYRVGFTCHAQVGDEVWILYGSNIPFVLRGLGLCYTVISPAVIVPTEDWEEHWSGFMLGRAIDLVDMGLLKLQNISLC